MQGLVIDKPDAPFGLPIISPDQWLYLFTLFVGALLFLLAWNLVRGRIGRAMMAIRDHALAAEAMGIDIALLKTRTFALSAMYTGVAGSLGAIVVQFVGARQFRHFRFDLFVRRSGGGRRLVDRRHHHRRVCSSSSCRTSRKRYRRPRPARSMA